MQDAFVLSVTEYLQLIHPLSKRKEALFWAPSSAPSNG